MYKKLRLNTYITKNIILLMHFFREIGTYLYAYVFLFVLGFMAICGLKTQKVFMGMFFLPLIVYFISIFIWVGFNSSEAKPLQAASPEVATMNMANPALINTILSDAQVDLVELTDDSLVKLEVAISNDIAKVTEDYSISELFAGRGGYDLSASTVNYSLLNAGPPNPKVWVKQIQDADVYSAVTYMSYRIREGDMIGIIAERFNLTQDTLISVNNIRQTRLIQIDEYIRVPSMPGVLYTTKTNDETPFSIAEKHQVSAKKTAAVNDFEENTALKAGVTVFVPDAFLDWVTRQEINGDLFLRPLRNRYHISSNFGWRNSPFTGARSFHNGIDLAAPKMTPVYGALVGRVTTAKKDDRVYGNYVIVTHHSGYSTLYGHMAELNVSVGQSVSTNSVLGWIGSTGMSTGNHLHFSVLKYGKSVNPVSLWH